MAAPGRGVACNASATACKDQLALPAVAYLLRSFSTGFGLAGCCGRRNEAVAWAGFLSAFGFLASRLPRLRSLAKAVLPVVQVRVLRTIGRKIAGAYGVFFSTLRLIGGVRRYPRRRGDAPAQQGPRADQVGFGGRFPCPGNATGTNGARGLAGSIMAELQATDKPDDQDDDQYKPENAARTTAAVTAIAVVATATTE